MKTSALLWACIARTACASILLDRAKCNDNCGRQVIATRRGAPPAAQRSADCMNAVGPVVTVTVAPGGVATVTSTVTSTTSGVATGTLSATSTSTSTTGTTSTTTTTTSTTTDTSVTVTSTGTVTSVSTIFSYTTVSTTTIIFTTLSPGKKRAVTAPVPAYASGCTRPGQYASACSCLGVTASTSTATVTGGDGATGQSTSTVFVTTTTSIQGTASNTVTGTATTLVTTTSFTTSVITVVSTATSSFTATTLTTTSFTTSATSTSVSVIATTTSNAPPIVLTSATPIVGNVQAGSTSNYDDQFFPVVLPFALTIYGVSNTKVFVGVNGAVFVQDPNGPVVVGDTPANTDGPGPIEDGPYLAWENDALPVYCDAFTGGPPSCTGDLPRYIVLPFWDDLYIYAGTPQGLYYEVDGAAPHRTVTFEWYTSHFQAPQQYYHFTATFYEDTPGDSLFKYYQISDGGNSATVGAQGTGTDAGDFVQYSLNSGTITNGLTLLYDASANTITAQ